jgi:hypothetical protein
MTAVGLARELVERAVRPGSVYKAEVAPVKQAALAARGAAVDTEVLGEGRVRQTAYFRDIARPLGGKHSLLGYFVLRVQVIGGAMLGRTGGPFREEDIDRVANLLPDLAVARASHGLDDAAKSGWPYIDLLHVAAGLARCRERALFIASGGAVGPRQFAVCYRGIQLDVVEPEKRVIDLAKEFFGLDDIPHLRVRRAEGAVFLRAARESWDIIVVDAYDGDELGEGICRRPFFRSLRERLRPGGAFAFNVVGALDGSGAVRSVAQTATSVFDDVLLPVMTTTETYAPSTIRNVVVIGVR